MGRNLEDSLDEMRRAQRLQDLRKHVLLKLGELDKDNGDIELMHSEADKQLCLLLNELGYSDVVDAWDRVPKWYA